MASTKIQTFDNFVNVHGILLAASGIPKSLHFKLFQKLSSETFDGGNFFQIEPCQDGLQRRLVSMSKYLAKESDLFLVDIPGPFASLMLPNSLNIAAQKHENFCGWLQLQDVPGLAERMATIMCVDNDLNDDSKENELVEGCALLNADQIVEGEICNTREKGLDTVRWLELEELDLDDDTLLSLNLSSKFPDLCALSLCANKLNNVETIIEEVTKFKHLRALWLNNNPVLKNFDKHIEVAISQRLPSLEIYNSRFTNRYGEWALGFCGGLYGKDNPVSSNHDDRPLLGVTSLDLSNRCIHDLVNKDFSPVAMPLLSYLNLRGNPLDQNTAGELFVLLKGFPELQALEVDIPGPVGESALDIIGSLPDISMLNGIDVSKILETGKHVIDSMLQPRLPEWTAEEPVADRVLNAMWLYLMTYRLANEEKIDETSVWYVMDELGSALRHSDVPNFRVSPFLYMPDGKLESAVSFSILWPVQNVHKGEECTRDFLFGVGEDKQRSARLTAWFCTPQKYFIQVYEKHCRELQSRNLPLTVLELSPTKSLLRNDGRALRVYTDIPHVEDFLTRPEFFLTSDPKDADIIWTGMQIDDDTKKATGITDQQYINQFPYEACLVMKHHLAETVQKALVSPEWFQSTYNLETHLSQLIGDYYVRKRDGLDNLWILKPWNMARTIDTSVTGDLSAIIRLMETGPKICQKYIERPALFKGKKFDLRYIVLVRSISPLEIFLSDVFWVRLANNAYSLEKHSLYDYETHFTVMNYGGRKFSHMNTPDFVKEFEEEHEVKWLDIHTRIANMIRSVFESAALLHPEMHNPKSRAMYGVDVMLDSSFKPKLLEVTYCPDCMRACTYDTKAILKGGEDVRARDFFNFVFGCLFLNETTHVTQI